MQMSSVRRCFNWVFYFREEEESGWKPGELRYVCKFDAYQTYKTCHICTRTGYKQQLLVATE